MKTLLAKYLVVGSILSAVFGLNACSDENGVDGNNGNGDRAEISYGTLVDERDGQTYKTVTIGTQTWLGENGQTYKTDTIVTQTWMAENLNYDPGDVSSMGRYAWSGCYDNESANCSKYGRLYTWEVAMDKADCDENYCDNSYEGTKGVCPSGWHLPSNYDWNVLWTAVGGTSRAGTTDWNSNGTGEDVYGFSVLPAGYRLYDGSFNRRVNDAGFWSSTEDDRFNALTMNFNYRFGNARQGYDGKNDAFSVRCLKD